MTTTRRSALRALITAATLPALLRNAWATPAREVAAFEAYRRASERGRPLLAIVVPTGSELWGRGEMLGALLNHGGDEVLATLALCEVVCAEPDVIGAVTGATATDQTLFVLVETDRVPGAVRTVSAPEVAAPVNRWDDVELDAQVDEQIRRCREALLSVVLPDRAALTRYAAHAEARAPRAARAVASFLMDVDPEFLDQAPSVLALAAAERRVPRADATAKLAAMGRSTWVEQAVPGSRWARAGGCGVTIEGQEDNVMMGCGMGHVATRARRMLYFYET